MDNNSKNNPIETLQPTLYTQLQRSYKHGSLAHAYLFEGPSGTGKTAMALWLAKSIFCLENHEGIPCEHCVNCKRIEAGEHPDVLEVKPEGQTIKIEQIRQLKSAFTRSGLETKQKVFIIHDAEKMTVNAANGLLKFLEEPDGSVCAILLTEARVRILPTIQSRCQVLHFKTLPKAVFLEKLQASGISEKQGEFLLGLTNSLSKAVEFSQDEWFNGARDCVIEWFQYLKKGDKRGFVFVQSKLLLVFKDKSQQVMCLDMLLVCYRQRLAQRIHQNQGDALALKDAQDVEKVLMAKRKIEANVTFQSVCEQLALMLIR